MPAPLSGELSPLLSAAYNLVRGAIFRGLGFNEIKASLDINNLQISTGQLLNMIGVVKRIETQSSELVKVDPRIIPPDETIPISDRNLRSEYLWTFRAPWIDPVTGEAGYKYVSVATDEPISAVKAGDTAAEILSEVSNSAKTYVGVGEFVSLERSA